MRRLGAALDRSARLVLVPEQLLMLVATVVGKGGVARRLCRAFCVDITKTRQLMDWSPPVSAGAGLGRTAEAFRREAHL